ncbi:MAG: ABC transporter permease subunit, partial [Fusobacteriaceae bacterium]
EEASLEGIDEWNKFFRIKLPLIFPAILRGGFLVFIYSFTSFILVIAIGGLKHSTLEAEIATTLLGSLNFNKVLILGLLQCFILTFLNIITKYVPEYELSGKGYSKKTHHYIKYFSIFYIIFEISVISISFIFSFFNFYTGNFSFNHFLKIISPEFNEEFPVILGFFNSTLLSLIGASLVIIIAYLLIRNSNKFTDLIVFSTMGFSTGFLGIILVYLNISLNIPLWILVIQGYLLIALPIGYSFLFHYIHNFPKDMLEAGEIDGITGYKRFIYLEFPNLKNIFSGVFLQIFSILFGEFTLSYTMQLGDSFPTIGLVNYSLISSKHFLESSSLNSFILIFIMLIFIISQKLLEKNE